jgi:transcriptional regulator with XRE-family HTH domain
MRVIQDTSSRRGYTAFRRKNWGNFFGGMLCEARLERGRSVEDAARAAGMEVSEWEAVEAGQVPASRELIHRMADGLGVDRKAVACLVLFCREAWDE